MSADLRWVRGEGQFNLSGPYLTDEVKCLECRCPVLFEFIESISSQAPCVIGCVHLRARQLREDGMNWYGFKGDDNGFQHDSGGDERCSG